MSFKRILFTSICVLQMQCTTTKEVTGSQQSATMKSSNDYIWMQYTYSGDHTEKVIDAEKVYLSVRAITKNAKCPALKSNKDSDYKEMNVRIQINNEDFGKLLVCQRKVEAGETQFQVNDFYSLFVPEKENKVFVIGDSGRPELSESPILAQVSKKITDVWKGDSIVVHVGDYVYSTKDKTETWNAWEQEFFVPTFDLMKHTPFLFVRGNHETCAKEADKTYSVKGWFWFLDPIDHFEHTDVDYNTHCTKITPAYPVTFAGYQFGVLDSSDADANKAKDASKYADQLTKLNKYFKTPAFIATHRPFWAWDPKIPAKKAPHGEEQNKTLQEAYSLYEKKTKVSYIRHVLSGHEHLFDFQALDSNPLANQIIVGMSGNEMIEVGSTTNPDGPVSKHGYAYMDAKEEEKIYACFLTEEACNPYFIAKYYKGKMVYNKK